MPRMADLALDQDQDLLSAVVISVDNTQLVPDMAFLLENEKFN